jgi:hypothetical protein
MADASRSELPQKVALGVVGTWRRLNFEQRAAAVGALLLIVSTFGPFSFVEAAIVLIGLSVLFLLRRRAEGREFHVPFGDGTVIAAAGAWAGALIMFRVFDRPLGQGLLALVCAAILIVAGLAERRKHLPDDLPAPDAADRQRDASSAQPARARPSAARRVPPATDAATQRLPAEAPADADTAEHDRVPRAPDVDRERLFDPESGTIDELRSVHDEPTEPLPPPEYDPPTRRRPPAPSAPDEPPTQRLPQRPASADPPPPPPPPPPRRHA